MELFCLFSLIIASQGHANLYELHINLQRLFFHIHYSKTCKRQLSNSQTTIRPFLKTVAEEGFQNCPNSPPRDPPNVVRNLPSKVKTLTLWSFERFPEQTRRFPRLSTASPRGSFNSTSAAFLHLPNSYKNLPLL